MSYLSMFIISNLLMIFLSLSSSSWLMVWVYMEMVVFFFIPILYDYKSSLVSSLKLWSYFIVQSISSFSFILFIILEGWNFMNYFLDLFLLFSVFLKMGIPPFHGWIFKVCENLDWMKFFMINSIQKMIPLWVIMNLDLSILLMLFSLISLIVCSFLCVCSEFSFRWMMMVSSSLNSIWMICSSVLYDWSVIFYVLSYFFVFYYVVKYFNLMNLLSLSSLVDLKLKKYNSMILFILSFFFLIGVPPFGLFLGKFHILMSLISHSWLIISMLLVFSSGLMVVVYLMVLLGLLISFSGFSLISTGNFLISHNLFYSLIILFLFSFYG